MSKRALPVDSIIKRRVSNWDSRNILTDTTINNYQTLYWNKNNLIEQQQLLLHVGNNLIRTDRHTNIVISLHNLGL